MLLGAWQGSAAVPAMQRYLRENGWGFAGSFLLHGLILLLILFFVPRSFPPPQPPSRIVSVEVVRLGPETVAPPAPQKAVVPQQRAARIPVPRTSSPKPAAVGPKVAPVADEMEAKLRGLARLRQPDAPLHAPDNAQEADTDATSDGIAGDRAAYSLRDYIRAQVERRWSLNLALLGNRNLTILLRVEITSNGIVRKSEIVDQSRFKTDAVYHEIALSARNAVLLSSPLTLPAGDYKPVMDVTLNLNPRDTLK